MFDPFRSRSRRSADGRRRAARREFPPPPPVPIVIPEPPRVLVLTEADPLRERLAEALVRQGFEAVPTAAPSAAVELAARPPGFDMAVLDMGLPRVTATEVVSALRESDPGLFVAMLPSGATREDLAEGYRAGASAALRATASPDAVAGLLKAQLPGAGRTKPRRSFGSGVVAWLRRRRVRRPLTLAAAGLVIGVSLAAGVEWVQGFFGVPDTNLETLVKVLRQQGGDGPMERALLLEHLRLTREANDLTRRY